MSVMKEIYPDHISDDLGDVSDDMDLPWQCQ